MTPAYDRATIAALVDARLPWAELRAMMSAFKDRERFDTYVAVLQSRVPWTDRILLPCAPHLYIVQTRDGARVTKCDCGFEFGDYRTNWKHAALISVRDTAERLQELYPRHMHADPRWIELREFYCPGCGAQLEVEAVPPGYPIVHDFEPDLETFYRDWLGRPLPDPGEAARPEAGGSPP